MFKTFLLAAGLVFCQQRVAAQTSDIDQVLKELESVTTFSGVSISPDGHWVTWVKASADHSGDSEIYLLARTGAAAQAARITSGDGKTGRREHSVVWSPDSKQFAFLRDQNQIYIVNAGSRKVRMAADLSGYVTDVRWRPDGAGLAYLFAANGGGGGPLEAVPAQTGVIGGETHNQRLMVMNSTSQGAEAAAISPADLNIYEYDWSADGERFAAIAAPGPADNNWWTAKLYTLGLRSKEMKLVYTPPVDRQIAVPRWSPDGKTIAFIGGLMSDEGFLGGDIFALAGGGVTDLTPGMNASASGLAWRGNKEILFTEDVEGGGGIALLNVTTGKVELVWKGPETLHEDGNYPNLSLAADGVTSAAIRSTWAAAPEVWAGKIGEWDKVTRANDEQRPHWGKAENVTWQSDGNRVQGWLVYPEHFAAGKKYPMVVEIHGGPASMRGASWPGSHFDMSVMAGLGYFVFFPNPRGSYGEGEEFTRANVKDFGYGDLRDILAGVDAVAKLAPIDERRIGVTGWSYGGYMTMWTVTQTQRFSAAVAGAGIANWQSYYGENSIDEWMIPYFGASVYDDPAVYAKSSPITFIKQVKTPTLVIVGERDGECPAPQSFEFWHALKTNGVPTELVVYPGEGHSFREAKDRVDVLRRTLAWFQQYLK
jgi:dipeptidyl aminopeptidase/acylaminoacyl peptidase